LKSARWVTGCPTGKRGYFTRADARAAKRTHANKGLSVYECPACHDWHLGHLPRKVRRGEITRADIFPPAESLDYVPVVNVPAITRR